MCKPYPTFVKASPDIPDIALTATDVEQLNLPTPKPPYSPTDPRTGLSDFLVIPHFWSPGRTPDHQKTHY